jgi:hypothetical protein
MGKSKEELYEIINAAKEELAVIETNEYLETNKSLVGKCYKCKDCYSCPQNENDFWWDYMKVTGTNNEGDMEVFVFYKDAQERINITPNETYSNLAHYTEITPEEFDSAWINLLSSLPLKI